jgi:hypothetical protein
MGEVYQADGRLIMLTAARALTETQRIDIGLNWFEELKKRVPVP